MRKEYTVINIDDDGFVSLMNESGDVKEDLKLPEDEWLKDVVERIKKDFQEATNECMVMVLSAMGIEKIVDVREGKA